MEFGQHFGKKRSLGQATTEYILLLGCSVVFFFIISRGLKPVLGKFSTAINTVFTTTFTGDMHQLPASLRH